MSHDYVKEATELLKKNVEALVDNASAVKINAQVGDGSVVFFLRVEKSDVGKVIGKKGRTAEALRTILTAFATKCRMRAVLEIED